jgi:hypothetical protein
MIELMHTTRRRLACLMGASVLLAGAAALLAAGPAGATACGTAIAAGANCTMTGSLGLSGGTLTLTSPSALGWTATLSGLDLDLADPTPAHQSYLVDDATGSGGGWHVTTSATQFTTGGGSPLTLGNTGTFSTNGSTSSIASTTAPSPACSTLSTCTLPTNTMSYPVAITTAASAPTPATIYDTSLGTGLGSITIGTTNPVGWWLYVPASTAPGTYTSTVTMAIVSGP